MKTKFQIIFLLGIALLTFNACNNNTYWLDKEVYEKSLFLLGQGDYNIFNIEYEYDDEGYVGYVPIHCTGSLPVEEDVQIELEYDSTLVPYYNRREFDIDTIRFAKELDISRFNMETMTVTMKQNDIRNYALFPLKIRIEGLSPDTTYFVPLKIKSVSKYSINPLKSAALIKIFLKNDYATTSHDTNYKLQGFYLTEGDESAIFVSGVKKIKPLSKNKVRFFPETYTPTSRNEFNDIKRYGMILTINSDNTVVIEPYDMMVVVQSTDEACMYYPESKKFELFYSYRNVNGKWVEAHEIFSLVD